jgi:uncharacterized protein (DUF1800 family)
VLILELVSPAGGGGNDAAFGRNLPQEKQILHVLNRLTFGPAPGDIDRVRKTGLQKWMEQQLHPERVPENPVLESKLRPLESLRMDSAEMVRNYPPRQMIRTVTQGRRLAPQQVVALDLGQAKILRAIYSNRQLTEVLADFWYNHFNVFLDKGADRYLVTSYERDAIRPHVLGRFQDILRATAEHPAMLFYLDNWQSVDPNAVQRRGRRTPGGGRLRGLNENYARELLELHTMGVDGGYTQKDVTEVARCFTGWTIRDPRRGGAFEFNMRMHDPGEKTVLGVRIPAGGGKEDGLKVLDLLAKHPSTARFISYKLAQRFVADQPPPLLVERMAKTFRDKDGDIREVMRMMLSSREFRSEGAFHSKVKSPLEMVTSAVRAMGGDVNFAFALVAQVGRLGQPLYRKQEPTGYPNSGEEWVNSAGLVGRMNFAVALTSSKLPGVKIEAARWQSASREQVAREILFSDASTQTRAAIEKSLADGRADQTTIAALVIGSPEFQRR